MMTTAAASSTPYSAHGVELELEEPESFVLTGVLGVLASCVPVVSTNVAVPLNASMVRGGATNQTVGAGGGSTGVGDTA
jgi:hypothetical protein